MNDITGFLNAQHAELVDVVVELLDDKMLWQGDGVWTMPQWLTWRCGVSTATAKKIVVIAERANDLPVTLGAFRRGELSLDQAAAVARKAPAWADEQASGFARRMTVHQLQRTMTYPFPDLDESGGEGPQSQEPASDDTAGDDRADVATDADPDPVPTAEDSADGQEWMSHVFDDDGTFRLLLATDFATGHVVMAALGEARDALFNDGNADVTWLDAVREVADRSLDGVSDSARRSRFKVNVYIDADAPAPNLCDASGWTVPDAIRRHLTCDGTITPVFLQSGMPVSVGRSQRIVPERTRTIIERRDNGCCRVPGCTRTHGLEVHHIVHWEYDGVTDAWNLMLICRHHHRQHHRGRLGITGNADLADSLTFTNARGQPIRASGAAPNPPNGPPPQPEGVYEHPLGERLDTRWLYFNPPRAS